MANDERNKKLAPLMEALLEEAIRGLLGRLTIVTCEDRVCTECSAPIKGCGARAASPQDFANVLKLLKDNGFTIDPLKGGDELDKLIEKTNALAQSNNAYPKPS